MTKKTKKCYHNSFLTGNSIDQVVRCGCCNKKMSERDIELFWIMARLKDKAFL
jgi:hypothetical protein